MMVIRRNLRGNNGRTKHRQMPPPERTREREKRWMPWIPTSPRWVGEVKPSRRGSPNSLRLFLFDCSYAFGLSVLLVNLVSRVLRTRVLPRFRSSVKYVFSSVVPWFPPRVYAFSIFYKSQTSTPPATHLPSIILTPILCLGYCTSTSSSLCNP